MAEDESSDCDYVDGASDARRFVTMLIKTCQTDVAEHGYKAHDMYNSVYFFTTNCSHASERGFCLSI